MVKAFVYIDAVVKFEKKTSVFLQTGATRFELPACIGTVIPARGHVGVMLFCFGHEEMM